MKDTVNNTVHDAMHHGHDKPYDVFENVEIFVEKFDGAERDEWQKPDEVIKSFNLLDNAVVVELGAGTGYFAVRLAPHLKNGKVICFDRSTKMTSYLKNRAKELGFTNIDARTTEADDSPELEENANLIFSVDVYHHLKDRIAYFSKIAKYLTSNGIIVIIDRTEEKIEGQPTGHRVPKEIIKEEMKGAGFELVTDYDFLLPIQYYLTFRFAP